MSTRSNVVVRLHDEDLDKKLNVEINGVTYEFTTERTKPYLCIYIHHDGGLDGVGQFIKDKLNNYDDILKYVLMGDRTSADTSYVECGEEWEDDQPVAYETILKDNIPLDYLYLYENNHWEYGQLLYDPYTRNSYSKWHGDLITKMD